MDTNNDRPNLSRTLFWDVDFDKIDWPNRAQFVIERVLERGSFPEWQEIKRYYGVEAIKQAALNARHLDDTALSFCSAYFSVPQEQFRCYIQKSLNPVPWVF
jgi:hypothetical protein